MADVDAKFYTIQMVLIVSTGGQTIPRSLSLIYYDSNHGCG